MFKNFSKIKYNRGLTIIELLVVVSIFVIITGISIFNYSNFNSSISTQNLADDIALTVRRAQGYAIGVRGIMQGFDNRYGVHFTINSDAQLPYNNGSNKSMIFFADIGDDLSHKYIYNYNENTGQCGLPVEGDECLEVLNIKSGDEIKNIYQYTNGSNLYQMSKEESLDIVFARPNPEPFFSDNYGELALSSVIIEVSKQDEPDAESRFITIHKNGQISVSNKRDGGN